MHRTFWIVTACILSASTVLAQRLDPPRLDSPKQSDLISLEDIRRSPGGYRLSVPAVGDVYLMALRAPGVPGAGKDCRIHKPSLIRLLAADPPVLRRPKWIQLTIYDSPVGLVCLGPLGGGCYILVR
jgi:hypothetical protein